MGREQRATKADLKKDQEQERVYAMYKDLLTDLLAGQLDLMQY
jgi:hypothetical protein